MLEALDTDTDPDNPDGTSIYEPYYYGPDNAAVALDDGQEQYEKDHGQGSGKHLMWGVRKIPKPPPLLY